MKRIVLPALAAVCGAAIAYAAGPNSPVQLAQVQQYKDTTQFKEAPAYKMDKGTPRGLQDGQGAGTGQPQDGTRRAGTVQVGHAARRQRGATDQDHKGWSSSGAQGQYKAPGGQALKGEGPQAPQASTTRRRVRRASRASAATARSRSISVRQGPQGAALRPAARRRRLWAAEDGPGRPAGRLRQDAFPK